METKILLSEDEIPKQWYNVLADFKNPPPPVLHPQTLKPIGPQDLAPLFPMALIEQEVSPQRWMTSRRKCWTFYTMWRPTPHVSGPIAWKRRWAPRRKSTTSTKA